MDRPAEILMIEDDEADILMTRETLEESDFILNLNIVNDGVEGMNYLNKLGKYENATLPDIILLDLNMPRKGGMEVLAEIKQDEKLKSIPVIILTTSKNPEEVKKAYALGVNCFTTKPVSMVDFEKVILQLKSFWFDTVQIPSGN